jgi:hypothetical protein
VTAVSPTNHVSPADRPRPAFRWPTRDSFSAFSAALSGGTARSASGLLLISPDAEIVAPLTETDRTAALDLAAATLAAAGLGAGDRVVVALNNDGELSGALIAQAAAGVAEAAASVGARGRMRLHRALEAVRATTLITTPTGAMDFLARLHLEFLLDPLDLELRQIILVGEIASPGTYGQLAVEFEASVVELYADPFFGIPVAHRIPAVSPRPTRPDRPPGEVLTPVRDGLLEAAPLDEDAVLDAPYSGGLAELVITPTWHSTLATATLRTGHVVQLDGVSPPSPVSPRPAEPDPGPGRSPGVTGLPSPVHTVGEHVLVRGRWLSIPGIATALARIDGISHWELRLSRAGTLDAAALHVTFNRATLISNPMWTSRIAQALTTLTPVAVDVVVEPEIAEQTRPGTVTDLRGHHLGRDRTDPLKPTP